MSRIWRSFSKRTTISPLRYSTLWAIATLSLLFASNVYSQAPHSLSFQGFVTDDGGVPIEEPNVSMTFKLYDQATEIWSETQPSVSIESGIFNVLLGSVTPLDTVRFDRALLVGIKIGADPEMVPRTPLAAAAYAKALPGLYTSYHDDGSNKSYNVVGGGANNIVGPGVTGATIGGGGGVFNSIYPHSNSALGDFGVIGGGGLNTVSSRHTTVGGGMQNTASRSFATVSGGTSNVADGPQATVPGGAFNHAKGESSFAAGFIAKAIHNGSFVWNDRSQPTIADSLASTGDNQFLIRAAGGVGVNTNQPLNKAKLHVEHGSMGTNDWGFVLSNVFSTNGSTSWRTGMRMSDGGYFEITNKANIASPGFARLDSGGNWTVVSDRRRKIDIEPASGMLEAALDLEPVRYYLKNQDQRGQKSLGMIAQQVQEVEPSLVTDGDPMTLNYSGLSVVAIGAIQGLYELVQELQAENQEMRAAMARAGME